MTNNGNSGSILKGVSQLFAMYLIFMQKSIFGAKNASDKIEATKNSNFASGCIFFLCILPDKKKAKKCDSY
jgi:hypothetical protein